MKHTNKLLKIILIITIITINVGKCCALNRADVTFTDFNQGNSVILPPSEQEPTEGDSYRKDNKLYGYSYYAQIKSSKSPSIAIIDLNKNQIEFDGMKVSDTEKKFKAGTWVGVNLVETQQVSWSITNSDITYYELRKKYTCIYTKNPTPNYEYKEVRRSGLNSRDECRIYSVGTPYGGGTIYKESACFNYANPDCNGQLWSCSQPYLYRNIHYYRKTLTPTTYDPKEVSKETDYYQYPDNVDKNTICKSSLGNGYNLSDMETETIQKEVINKEITDELREKAIAATENEAKGRVSSPKSALQYMIYDSSNDTLVNAQLEDAELIKNEEKKEDDGTTASGQIIKIYEIVQKNVCIDVKTAEVSYGETCKNNLKEESVKALSNIYQLDETLGIKVHYWHYFIPLNAKSNMDFTVDIIKNKSSTYSVVECANFMEEKSDKYTQTYTQYIIPADPDKQFIGDYGKFKEESQDYKTLKQGDGCVLSTKIEFPISQEFYNEVEKSTDNYKLQGFNFYYKPIDINNPFPNGLSTTSIWSAWEKTTKKSPDLSKSFAKESKTYVTTNINANKIREYNQNNSYTSWQDMYTTGVSKFIETQGIVTRLVDTDSFYKLGCGPVNKDWEACKKS